MVQINFLFALCFSLSTLKHAINIIKDIIFYRTLGNYASETWPSFLVTENGYDRNYFYFHDIIDSIDSFI